MGFIMEKVAMGIVMAAQSIQSAVSPSDTDTRNSSTDDDQGPRSTHTGTTGNEHLGGQESCGECNTK